MKTVTKTVTNMGAARHRYGRLFRVSARK